MFPAIDHVTLSCLPAAARGHHVWRSKMAARFSGEDGHLNTGKSDFLLHNTSDEVPVSTLQLTRFKVIQTGIIFADALGCFSPVSEATCADCDTWLKPMRSETDQDD